MKTKNNNAILLIGCCQITSTLVTRFQELHPEIVIASVTEQLRSPFEPEPIRIINHRDLLADPIFYENEPSKFISKPKNNFKK